MDINVTMVQLSKLWRKAVQNVMKKEIVTIGKASEAAEKFFLESKKLKSGKKSTSSANIHVEYTRNKSRDIYCSPAGGLVQIQKTKSNDFSTPVRLPSLDFGDFFDHDNQLSPKAGKSKLTQSASSVPNNISANANTNNVQSTPASFDLPNSNFDLKPLFNNPALEVVQQGFFPSPSFFISRHFPFYSPFPLSFGNRCFFLSFTYLSYTYSKCFN